MCSIKPYQNIIAFLALPQTTDFSCALPFLGQRYALALSSLVLSLSHSLTRFDGDACTPPNLYTIGDRSQSAAPHSTEWMHWSFGE